jgi:type I restriction enzyme M protein
MEAKFEVVHAELAPKYKGRLKPVPADYQAKGAIFLPEIARFSRLLALPGTADLAAPFAPAAGVVKPVSDHGLKQPPAPSP